MCQQADGRAGSGQPSAELLGRSDDDALGPADVAEPVAVLVLRHLAEGCSARLVERHAPRSLTMVGIGPDMAVTIERSRRWAPIRGSAPRPAWGTAGSLWPGGSTHPARIPRPGAPLEP